MNIIKLSAIAAAIFLFAAACSDRSATNTLPNVDINAKRTPLPKPSIDEFALGQKVYEQHCTFCHQADGTGGSVEFEGKVLNADNLTDEKRKALTDEKIIGYVMNGIPDKGMPAFKQKLSEGEMRDVVVYIRKALQTK